MHREHYQTSFAIKDLPAWPCPGTPCPGVLHLKKDSVRIARTAQALLAEEMGGYEYGEDVGRYSALLTCVACREPVFVVGMTKYLELDISDSSSHYQFVWPSFLEPSPPMIRMPEKCPRRIQDALRDAFSIYWTSPGGSANSVGIGVERLMDALGVPVEFPDKNGAMKSATLHRRIEHYRLSDTATADLLLAAKFLGNHGSHGSPVTHKDVLDMLEIVEIALTKLYPPDISRVSSLAAQIIAAGGPV